MLNLKPQTLILNGCVFVLKEDSEYFVMPTIIEKVSVETNTDRTKTSNRKVRITPISYVQRCESPMPTGHFTYSGSGIATINYTGFHIQRVG